MSKLVSTQGTSRDKVAVIGGGVSGIVAAYLMQSKYDVTLFESENRLGGHTNTVEVPEGPDAGTPIDTGFIVLNDRTYPNLHRFLERLSVPVRYSDMSFGFVCEDTGIQYSTSSLGHVFAQRSNLSRLSYLKFLWGIGRFWSIATRGLTRGSLGEATLQEFLSEHRVPRPVVDRFVVPLSAAIWSAPASDIFHFPVQPLLRFLANHGMLSYFGQPKWQTVVGGSYRYIHAFQKNFRGQIVLNAQVQKVVRRDGGVMIVCKDREAQQFDRAILATHADVSLSLLESPTTLEQRAPGAWRYQPNEVVLHTDATKLPENPRARASWNYRREQGEVGTYPVSITYDMNRLQGLTTKGQYCVTLNPRRSIAESHLIRAFTFRHPVYSIAALRSQTELPTLNEQGPVQFCGSYFGHGFHEDAVRSAVTVAAQQGLGW